MVYVDNMLIVRPSISQIIEIEQAFSKRFQMNDCGILHYYLRKPVIRSR